LLLVPPGDALEPEDEVSLLEGLALDELLDGELLDGELLDGELLDGELPMDELGAEPLEVDSAGEGDEAPPALELEPLSLADDPLDDAPPAAPPAPPPCAHDTVARPNIAAVMAALISFSFIAWVPLGLGWDELRRHPRKNNAPGSNGLCFRPSARGRGTAG
jgi:hypothetical protein